MLPFKIGLHLPNLRLPMRQALAAAAQMGASYVELDLRRDLPAEELSRTGVRQIRKWLEDSGLRVSAAEFFTRSGYDDPDRIEARVAGTKKAMSLAYDLGSTVVVNHFGKLEPETLLDPQSPLRDALTELAIHGQRCGVTFAGTTVGIAPSKMSEALASLPEVGLGVNLDPAGLLLSGASVESALDLLGPKIFHVHARDASRDSATGRSYETELGRGSVDFAALIGRLEEVGYTGPLTIRQESDGDVEALRRAVRYLTNLTT